MGYLMEMIDRNVVLDRRSKGMSMYDIAEELWDQFHGREVPPSMPYEDALYLSKTGGADDKIREAIGALKWYRNRRNDIDQLIAMKGGVYDICMEGSVKDTSLESHALLAAAVIEAAVEDYGRGKTHHAEETQFFCEAKNFFLGDAYQYYVGVISSDSSYPDGPTLMKILDRQAILGRWIDYRSLKFKTKKAAQKMIDDHKTYAKNYEPYKKKRGEWRLRLIAEVE